jgi:hemerythrin-like domain-containing protein
MRQLMQDMLAALEAQNKDKVFGFSETLMILLQQHNMKEEQMLYAMCDRVLPPELKESTLDKMKSVEF